MTVSRFVRWWQENGDDVNKRRRDKYNSNREFREAERARKRKQTESPRRGLPRPRIYHHNGSPIVLWSVGRVAAYLGISKRTISNLEAKGDIPTNRVLDELRRRWWPEDYIKWLKPFVDQRKSREITARAFSRRVWNGWRQALATNSFPVLSEAREHEQASNSQERSRRRQCSLEDIFGPSGCHDPEG